MNYKELTFEQLMQLYNHIGDEERHFNGLELEYRKLASQWLLVSLGAIGFVLSKQEIVPVNIWALIIAICCAASIGILVLWLLDLKVYHELLHSAFKEGVKLEKSHPEIFPQIRNNMLHSQTGGDIIKRVILYYFFSILVLIFIANISIWMMELETTYISFLFNIASLILSFLIYKMMTKKSERTF